VLVNMLVTLIFWCYLCLCTMLFQSEAQILSEPEPRGLPVDDPSPASGLTSDVDSPVLPGAADGSEPALDIGSATRGRRLVSTSQV